MQKPTPPRWADRLLVWFCDDILLEEIQGDLHEAFLHRVETEGIARARFRFVMDTMRFFRPYAFEKYSAVKQYLPMFHHLLRISLRNLLRRRSFTLLNMLGLTFGLTVILLITQFVYQESTYDRKMPQAEEAYRLVRHYRDQTYTCMPFTDYYQTTGQDQLRLIEHLQTYPEVRNACQVLAAHSPIGDQASKFLKVGTREWVVEDILYTNTGVAFAEMFGITLTTGDTEAAWRHPQHLLLTESLANRMWGKNWDLVAPLEELVQLGDTSFILAGVIPDPAASSHLDYELIALQSRMPGWGAYTYVELTEGTDRDRFSGKLQADLDQVYPGYSENVLEKGLTAIPVTDIHFTPGHLYELKPPISRAYLMSFGIVGLIILLIVITNYINLSIAMYTGRQKELSMRKMMGAHPRDISLQVLVESILLALCCLPFIGLLHYITMPLYNQAMGTEFSRTLSAQGWLWTATGLFLTGLLSGLYPAFRWSRQSLLSLLQQKLHAPQSKGRFRLKHMLLGLQFGMIVSLLSATGFMLQQMQYIQHKNLGYSTEGIIDIPVNGLAQYQALTQALSVLPEVKAIGAGGAPGGEMFNQLTYKLEGTETVFSDGVLDERDWGNMQALGLTCDPCKQLAAGKKRVFVINETAARKLAAVQGILPEELIGKVLISEPEWENEAHGNGTPHIIDGIIPDFNQFNLRYAYQPLLMDVVAQPAWAYNALLRAEPADWSDFMKKVEGIQAAIQPGTPFRATFLHDRIEAQYEMESRTSWLLSALSALAVILAMLGLAGMVAYLIHTSQREISIRRILGANLRNLWASFSREFVWILAASSVLALPIGYVAARQWIVGFAFQTRLNPLIPLSVAGLALGLILLIVGIYTYRTTRHNPVEHLRRA